MVRPTVTRTDGTQTEGPAKFQPVESLSPGELKGKTQFCFCKVPFVARKLNEDMHLAAKPRMRSALSYKKYVYYAERYVKGVEPYSTGMYHLEREVAGAESNKGAWTKQCCEANSEGCAITGSEAEGYRLKDGDTIAPEGATITSVGELHDMLHFDGPTLAEDGSSDFVSFEYRCK